MEKSNVLLGPVLNNWVRGLVTEILRCKLWNMHTNGKGDRITLRMHLIPGGIFSTRIVTIKILKYHLMSQ